MFFKGYRPTHILSHTRLSKGHNSLPTCLLGKYVVVGDDGASLEEL